MTTTSSTPAARADNITKVYGTGETEVRALDGVTVSFPRGQFTAIMGPSGSGKSTLMHCLAGLDTPTSGTVHVGHIDLTQLGDDHLTQLRRERIGFIFQSFNLIPTLTAGENISLPTDIAGKTLDQDWVSTVVKRLRIDHRLDHKPSELSGGQQQRVACARAIVSRPDIIFGDEPTGNLDSNSSTEGPLHPPQRRRRLAANRRHRHPRRQSRRLRRPRPLSRRRADCARTSRWPRRPRPHHPRRHP